MGAHFVGSVDLKLMWNCEAVVFVEDDGADVGVGAISAGECSVEWVGEVIEGGDGVMGEEEGGGFDSAEGVKGRGEVEADHDCCPEYFRLYRVL